MSDPKQFFLDMAARIERNEPTEFGGVMLIVPPKGDPIEYFFVTTRPDEDETFFWAQCKAKLDTTAADRLERMSNPDPFGARRR